MRRSALKGWASKGEGRWPIIFLVGQTVEPFEFKGRQNLRCVQVIEDQCLNVVDEALQ